MLVTKLNAVEDYLVSGFLCLLELAESQGEVAAGALREVLSRSLSPAGMTSTQVPVQLDEQSAVLAVGQPDIKSNLGTYVRGLLVTALATQAEKTEEVMDYLRRGVVEEKGVLSYRSELKIQTYDVAVVLSCVKGGGCRLAVELPEEAWQQALSCFSAVAEKLPSAYKIHWSLEGLECQPMPIAALLCQVDMP